MIDFILLGQSNDFLGLLYGAFDIMHQVLSFGRLRDIHIQFFSILGKHLYLLHHTIDKVTHQRIRETG